MTVRCQLLVVAALLALAFGASCRKRDATQTVAEIAEPAYIEAVRLNKQARYAEALASFLEVIEKRGLRFGAPEAHFEAGQIYLYRLKDPNEAIYHFKRYLAALPNSKEAPLVHGQLQEATREFARTLPARPLEDQSVRLESAEEIARLRRENAELRAENEVLRGAVSSPVARSPRGMAIDVSRLLSPAPVDAGQPPMATPPPSLGTPIMQAPPRVAPSPLPTSPSLRTHTIKQSEGLLAIARQYDARNPGPKMRQIIEANPDILPDGVNTPLKPGMVLRIP